MTAVLTLVGAVRVQTSTPPGLCEVSVPVQPSTEVKFETQLSPPPMVFESATSKEKVVTVPVPPFANDTTKQSVVSNPVLPADAVLEPQVGLPPPPPFMFTRVSSARTMPTANRTRAAIENSLT